MKEITYKHIEQEGWDKTHCRGKLEKYLASPLAVTEFAWAVSNTDTPQEAKKVWCDWLDFRSEKPTRFPKIENCNLEQMKERYAYLEEIAYFRYIDGHKIERMPRQTARMRKKVLDRVMELLNERKS